MKISITYLVIFVLIITFSGCEKIDLKKNRLPDIVVSDIYKDPIPAADMVYERKIEIGLGSGSLIIDGSKLRLKCNDLLTIKAGSYTNIEIKNIISPDGCLITIKNDGLVEVKGDFNQMSLTDLRNVIISGDGSPSIKKGFSFKDNKYRAIQMFGKIDNFVLQYVEFINIKDTNVSYHYTELYNGSDNSYAKALKFLNIKCENTSTMLSCSGSVAQGKITGLIKDLEIAELEFGNSSDAGSIVYIGNAENYNIHNNKVFNVNMASQNHNGIFAIAGNGRFHDNLIINHQGNSIRAFGHTVGNEPKLILIYNNIVVNSKKYSAFEVQAFAESMNPGQTTFTNAVIFNNTCGNLNLSKDWQGNVVDVYTLNGGQCDVYNNLAYNFQLGSAIAGQQSNLVPNSHDNLYFKTSEAAGLIDQLFFRLSNESLAKNKGIPLPLPIKDYYGNNRNLIKPSIGAVE